ncbi:hypothetical protein BDR05DRAFT_978456 [Suillus weaverae]|nr:hypothetical protein BDR05DRAFT_978456 [Suillus weaverae]
MFQDIQAQQEAQGLDPWAPFTDEEEWGLVKWLVSHVGHSVIDEFLKLIRHSQTSHMKTSFTSKYSLLKAIDKLPHATEWNLKRISMVGNRTANDGQQEMEDLELWLRDPVNCIHELMSNPDFEHCVSYAPEKVFADKEGKTCMFDEMWTRDWWWEMQGRLPKGAVVAPVILASDKTSLSQFCGDQEVWPMYLTLDNISKDIRHQPSKHAAILIAYLPISKLECFMQDICSVEHYHLFHYCMAQVLDPLVSVGENRVKVTCPDHQQFLITCCMEDRCPKCTVKCDSHGDMKGEMSSDHFESELGLWAIYSPFWAALPHNDIFLCMTPNILHQLHKGVFKDHLVSWCTKIIGEDKLNARLWHFKKGISKCKQWMGADYRELECVFLGVIAGAVNNQVLAAVRRVLDFTYYAQYQSHTKETLSHMQAALALFHANKNIIVKHGVQEHFNIPKFHSMVHYIDLICLFGSADGFNTELPKRLHIYFAKHAYRTSNRCDYVIQMTMWLRQQESIYLQDAYLQWWASQNAANEDSHLQDSDTSIDSDSDGNSPLPADHHQLQAVDLPRQIHHFTMLTASHGYFVPRTFDNHNTSLIIPALDEFLRHNLHTQSHRKLMLQDWVDMYKYVKASPEITSKDPKKLLSSAHFDMVLVIEDCDQYTASGEGISGLRVAEVKAMFDLLPHLGCFSCPLMYIHRFRPLQSFDENLQSFRLTRSSQQHQPNAAVLPVY